MICNFKIFLRARERGFWLTVYAWPVNEELNLAWFVNYLVLRDSISNSFSCLAECAISFSALWLHFEQVNLLSPILIVMFRHDMQRKIKFLRFCAFHTPHSTQESPWLLLEREIVLVMTRDAWNGQIFLRNSILQRDIGDPDVGAITKKIKI